MKKLILTTLLFISTISTFTSCSSENEYQEEKLDQKAIATKFQNDLENYYKNVTNNISNGLETDLKTILETTYKETFKSNADTEIFNDHFKNANTNAEYENLYVKNEVEKIIRNSNNENEAIKAFDTLINDESISFHNKLDYISIRESLIFLSNNQEYIKKIIASNNKNIGISFRPACDGWWDCWGQCVAGTIGGAVTGAATLGLAGAAVGTVALPIVGTVAGGTVGAVSGGIGGALTGAAASC